MLVLSRQKLPIFDRSKMAPAAGVLKGAYIISPEQTLLLYKKDAEELPLPDAILIATGSEVELVLAAQEQLLKSKINVRVVSMPSWEIFREQPEEYKRFVFPPSVRARLAVEAASPQGWDEWIGEHGRVLGILKFGASAPYKDIYRHYGLTIVSIVSLTKKIIIK